MNRDDIILMAQEANRYASNQTGDSYEWHFIRDERFAALVAAAEREACAAILTANANNSHPQSITHSVLTTSAAAIRARGSQ